MNLGALKHGGRSVTWALSRKACVVRPFQELDVSRHFSSKRNQFPLSIQSIRLNIFSVYAAGPAFRQLSTVSQAVKVEPVKEFSENLRWQKVYNEIKLSKSSSVESIKVALTTMGSYGRPNEALELLNQLESCVTEPEDLIFAYSRLLYAYMRSKDFKGAERCLGEMNAKGLSPTLVSLHIILFDWVCHRQKLKFSMAHDLPGYVVLARDKLNMS